MGKPVPKVGTGICVALIFLFLWFHNGTGIRVDWSYLFLWFHHGTGIRLVFTVFKFLSPSNFYNIKRRRQDITKVLVIMMNRKTTPGGWGRGWRNIRSSEPSYGHTERSRLRITLMLWWACIMISEWSKENEKEGWVSGDKPKGSMTIHWHEVTISWDPSQYYYTVQY